jgi:hypothetical protein
MKTCRRCVSPDQCVSNVMWAMCLFYTRIATTSVQKHINRDEVKIFTTFHVCLWVLFSKGYSFCKFNRLQNILTADTGIFRQTWSHSFGDHLISGSVSVTPSGVIEASIVLCSVSSWLVWVNVQSACAVNTRYKTVSVSRNVCKILKS